MILKINIILRSPFNVLHSVLAIIIIFFRRVFSECTEAITTLLIHSYQFSCEKSTETSNRMLTKFVSIGSYSPEVRTFGTPITSTKVFSLIICKTL